MNNLYRRLAVTNMKNNRQFYVPYLLAGIVSVMMFYSMRAMQGNDAINSMRGGMNLVLILTMGLVVIGIFVSILLFYTNSFIMKRRKKELGIYNILGMEKRHIAKVLFWESLISYVCSVVIGLVAGILFQKLLMMLLYRLTGLEQKIRFSVSWYGCLQTIELFGSIYLAILIYDFMQVRLAKPVELLSGSNAGEREPKTKLLLAIVGVACITGGYYIAITTEDIMKVLLLFLVAVILVMIGTYALFTAGSIALLKMLRSNKKFYYQTRHFTAVSGMIYRMKQNAVGLANICILSTMVLVMISTTVSMYAGLNDELENRYDGDISINVSYPSMPDQEERQAVRRALADGIKEQGRIITGQSAYADFYSIVNLNGNTIEVATDPGTAGMRLLHVFTRDDYEAMLGQEVMTLQQENEVLLVSSDDLSYPQISLLGKTYQVAGIEPLSKDAAYMANLIDAGLIYVVVKDDAALEEVIDTYAKIYTEKTCLLNYELAFDLDGTPEQQKLVADTLRDKLTELSGDPSGEWGDITGFSLESKQEGREDFLSINGGLLFLGLFLGSLFLMVTVLIIYYKQISEGYEDKERFAIMEKVGMSSSEVKTAITTQIRIVFFLPLVTAAIHLAAAFPMLSRLLAMLNLYQSSLFAMCLGATVLVFALIYLVVFKLTSRTYYHIVGEQF